MDIDEPVTISSPSSSSPFPHAQQSWFIHSLTPYIGDETLLQFDDALSQLNNVQFIPGILASIIKHKKEKLNKNGVLDDESLLEIAFNISGILFDLMNKDQRLSEWYMEQVYERSLFFFRVRHPYARGGCKTFHDCAVPLFFGTPSSSFLAISQLEGEKYHGLNLSLCVDLSSREGHSMTAVPLWGGGGGVRHSHQR